MVKSIRGFREWISAVWVISILSIRFLPWEVNWLMQCSAAVMTTEIGQFPRRKGANAAIFFIQFRGKLIVAPELGQWNRTHIAAGYHIWIYALWITGRRDFTNYNDNTWHLNTTRILSTCLQPACVFTFTKVQHFFGPGLGPFPLFLSTQILDALTRPRFPGCHGGVSQCDVMWRYFLRNEILTCFFPHISFFGKLGTGFVTESFNVDKPQQGSSHSQLWFHTFGHQEQQNAESGAAGHGFVRDTTPRGSKPRPKI